MTSMSEGQSVIIALLPRHAPREAHSTLCYLGEVGQSPTMEVVSAIVSNMAMVFQPLEAMVVKHDLFDVDASVPVAVLEGNDLQVARYCVETLANSKWGYQPHISEQPGYALPPVGARIIFDRVALWFGEQRLTWRFGTGMRSAS